MLLKMGLNGRKFNRGAHWRLTRFIFGGVVLQQDDCQLPFEVLMKTKMLLKDYSQPQNPILSVVGGCEALLEQRRL